MRTDGQFICKESPCSEHDPGCAGTPGTSKEDYFSTILSIFSSPARKLTPPALNPLTSSM